MLTVSAIEWKVTMLRVERADGNKIEENKDSHLFRTTSSVYVSYWS